MRRSAGVSAVLMVAVLALGFVLGVVVGASGRSTVTVTETFRTLVTTTVPQPGRTVTEISTVTVRTAVTQTTTVTTVSVRTVTETVRTLVTTTSVQTSVSTVTVQTTVTQTVDQVRSVCFSKTMNCASIIISLIDSAERSVLVAVYSFTSDQLADALIRAHRRGVEVRVVIEERQANVQGSEYGRLRNAGIQVRLDGNSGLMHHKFMVVDGEVVVTGSYNWSAAAEDRNDENIVVIYDRRTASLFTQEFERVWSQAS